MACVAFAFLARAALRHKRRGARRRKNQSPGVPIPILIAPPPSQATSKRPSRRANFTQPTKYLSAPRSSESVQLSSAAMEEDDRGQGQGDPAENIPECPAVEDNEEDDDGFSFPAPPLSTDSCIVPVYPIFGRPPFPAPPPAAEDEPETATLRVPLGRLLLEEREFRARQQDDRSASARHRHHHQEEEDDEEEASAAAGDEELDGVPPESYCLWAPGGGGQAAALASPRRCRKSGSTGSVLRWRRISDRLVGRSHSDGKEKFVFLNALPPPPPPPPANKHDEHEGSGGKGGDAAAGGAGRPWRYYGRGGGGAGGSGRRRSTYLPYKQELVGLFANVSGLRRSYHPF